MAWSPSIQYSQWPDIAYGDAPFDASEFVRVTAANSLGGKSSGRLIPEDPNIAQILSIETLTQLPRIHRLFDDVTSAQLTNGHTDYRAIFISNAGTATTGTNAWLVQPKSGIGTISVFQGTPDSNGYVERVKDELTAPAGAAWSTPTAGSPLALGAIAASGQTVLWFRRVLGAGAGTWPYDYFTLSLQATGEASIYQYTFYYTLRGTITTMTIAGDQDGSTVTNPRGEVYTITTKNSAGAATDPPENRVVALISRTLPRTQATGYPFPTRTEVQIQQAVRTAAGTYQLDFKPEHPGFHHIRVDAGGMVFGERSVEVSPIGDPTA